MKSREELDGRKGVSEWLGQKEGSRGGNLGGGRGGIFTNKGRAKREERGQKSNYWKSPTYRSDRTEQGREEGKGKKGQTRKKKCKGTLLINIVVAVSLFM